MPIFASNFTSNSLSGVTTVVAGNVTINLTPAAFALEGDKNFVVKLRKGSSQAAVVATSPVVTIKDRTTLVSLTANTATVNEGNLVAFSLVTTNVLNGVTVYYSVFPAAANVTADDFTSNTGSVVITNNAATFALQANINIAPVDETGENFRVQLRTNSPTGNIVFNTTNVTILDTYKTYNVLTFGPPSSTVLESTNVTFTFSATNVPLGTTLFYETAGNATVTSNTGSFVLNSLSNTFTVSAGDVPTSAIRAFNVNLRTGSSAGPIVATSNNVYVTDSALAYIAATGGEQVYMHNGFRVHVFLSSNNFTISRAGATAPFANVNYLVAAGGGAGGWGYFGGGGGSGGVITGNIATTAITYPITIGAGGAVPASSSLRGFNGSNSIIFDNIITYGGGAGGTKYASGPLTGGDNGGSGGGGSAPGVGNRGLGTPGQGQPGGLLNATTLYGSGGGGANQPGQISGGPSGGQGGAGLTSNISGTTTYGVTFMSETYYGAGGGGGGGNQQYSGGLGGGGTSGRGGGPSPSLAATAGTVNTGSGGGGGSDNAPIGQGAAGGSGIVIIRYPFVESPTYTSLTTTSNFTYETLNAVFTLNTLNLANNTLLYYTTVGNIISADFVSGNTGSFRTTSNTTTISLATSSNIPSTEERFFQLQVRADGLAEPVLLTSNVFTVKGSALGAGPNVEMLLVAGGASGGFGGGGGGAGGLLYYGANTTPKTPNGVEYATFIGLPYTITIGGGGAGDQLYAGERGSNTTILFNSSTVYTAIGGGGGGTGRPGTTPEGIPGGSGGGAGPSPVSPGTYTSVGIGITGQGNPGGNGFTGPFPSPAGGSTYNGGGGGGAGTAGLTAGGNAGAGGNGLAYDISGAYTAYAGGGGGGVANAGSPGAGGVGGGGAGGVAATQNTGGGGGGGPGVGRAGGSGVVVLRYPTASYGNATSTTGNPNVTVSGNFRIYRYWQSGSITF